MRRRGFVAAALLVVAASSVCLWLNVPKSLQLLAQGVGQQRHPVEFDFEFIGIDPGISRVPVQLFYLPQTPIFGLTKHYSSIIAPLSIDTITRSLDVDVRAGRVRFTAPLGLAGLSNYRLQSVDVGEADAPYALTSSIDLGDPSKVDRAKAPRSLDLPLIGVSDGQVHFDGAIALWRRIASEAHDDANPYAYSPLAQGPAQLIWDGLRGLTARIDLAPYPVGTFVVPTGWEGDGWKNEGYRLTRPHATLTDTSLELSLGVTVPLPFAHDCEVAPQVVVVSARRVPQWSAIDGLWRPVPRAVWESLVRQAPAPGLTVRFVPRASRRGALQRMQSFAVLARASGRYRVLAACANSHYASRAVTWIDVSARPASAGS